MNRHRSFVILALIAVLVPLLFTGCSHAVWPTGPSSITITGTSTVQHGGTQQLTSSVSGVAWSSSDTTIATVSSSGMVTGMASGTVTITATSGSVKGTFQMKVMGQASGTADSNTGATIQVNVPNSPINGTIVNVSADAVPPGEKINIDVDYADNPPSALPAGANAASKTLVLTKDATYDFQVPVTVTMPVDATSLANDDVPIVMAWSETYSKYIPVSLGSLDRTANTISFETNHFTKFVAAVVPGMLAQAQTKSLDTGFRPEVDGFFHPNFGSYEQPGGSSLGMALYSAWYYGNKKAKDGNGLYSKYLEGDPAKWQDDKTARELITRAYLASSKVWANISNKNKARPGAQDTATAIFTALQLTGEPQPLLLKGLTWAHAVLVYQWDATSGNFLVYDCNFPGVSVSLSWAQANGFSNYTKAAAYPGTIQSFNMEGTGIAAEGPEFENLYQGAESGWSQTKFGSVLMTTPQPDANNLAQLQSDQNVAIAGTVTGGAKTPKSVAYYLNGTKMGVATITGGQFSFTLAQLPRAANDLMLVATDDALDAWNAFGAFGEYTLQVQGKVFIVNPGFEEQGADPADPTGNTINHWVGWNHETHTWNNYTPGSFTPEKSSIVSTGYDQIDPTLSMVYTGNYAAMVNNYDYDYHISSVSQSIAVPNVSAPEIRFYWAAMLEDPGHPPSAQPYVDIQVTDDTLGTTLYYQHFFSNDPSYTGWKTIPAGFTGSPWQEIDWQPVMIDLSTAVGHNVTIRITAADCAYGGHGGYAYFDGDVN